MADTYNKMENIQDTQSRAYAARKSSAPSVSDGVSGSLGAAGMFEVLTAMLNNCIAVGSYLTDGEEPLVQRINEISDAESKTLIDEMAQFPSIIQGEIDNKDHGGKDSGPWVNKDMTQFNIYNTRLTQSNQSWGGMVTQGDTGVSNLSQTISVNMQMYSQGPETQLQNLVQCI